jgi:hypothetical protein
MLIDSESGATISCDIAQCEAMHHSDDTTLIGVQSFSNLRYSRLCRSTIQFPRRLAQKEPFCNSLWCDYQYSCFEYHNSWKSVNGGQRHLF